MPVLDFDKGAGLAACLNPVTGNEEQFRRPAFSSGAEWNQARPALSTTLFAASGLKLTAALPAARAVASQ
jgi:hypothetical protein